MTENVTTTAEAPPETTPEVTTPAPEAAPAPSRTKLPAAFAGEDQQLPLASPTPDDVTKKYTYGDEGDAGDEIPSSEPAGEEPKAEPSAEEEAATPEAEGETPEVEEEATPAAQEPMFDDGLMARAVQAGFRPRDFGRFTSADSLREAVTMIEQRRAEQPPAQPEATPEPAPVKAEDLAYKSTLDPDSVDPAIAKDLKGMSDHYAEQLAGIKRAHADEMDTMKQVVGQVIQQGQVTAQQSVRGRMDAWCDNQKNAGDVLNGRVNRDKLFDKANVIAAGYQAMGQPMPPEADLLDEAFRAEFGNETKTIARQQLAQKVEKRRRQAISRPTQRGTAPALTGTAAAIKHAEDFMRDHDMNPEQRPDSF